MEKGKENDIIGAIAKRAKASRDMEPDTFDYPDSVTKDDKGDPITGAALANAKAAYREKVRREKNPHGPNPMYDVYPEGSKQRSEADDERQRTREQRSKLERASQ